jgi:hypothetical protein
MTQTRRHAPHGGEKIVTTLTLSGIQKSDYPAHRSFSPELALAS